MYRLTFDSGSEFAQSRTMYRYGTVNMLVEEVYQAEIYTAHKHIIECAQTVLYLFEEHF